MLKIALSKGLILDQTLPLLEKAGITIPTSELESRKLILDTNFEHIKVIILRATDVPVFVQHGAADFGIAGKDVLMEHGADGVFELLDLGISKCRLMSLLRRIKTSIRALLRLQQSMLDLQKSIFISNANRSKSSNFMAQWSWRLSLDSQTVLLMW